ncbi:GDP-mannose 4,6-dehydratase, partial [candidate division KSB1 bacterium]|nr:GDP-mannose 4,6-dehydratase [candidate division KSB1 bacterium]
PRRGGTFVTRKITTAASRIKLGLQDVLYLGNLNAKRDWGYAPEFVEGMWRMLQQETPDDYVLATGENHTVRELAELAFKHLDISIKWQGKDENEIGIDSKTGKVLVKVDPVYYRPVEVDLLIGDASKAKEKLGWEPKVKFDELVKIMVDSDLEKIKKRGHLK